MPAPGLAQEIQRLDPLVVTGSKFETNAARFGSSLTVITDDELRLYNYVEPVDALRSVPGVGVQQSGSAGKLTTITIRGANSSQVQVLIDGLRVWSPTTGQFDFSDLSLDDIQRVEILRGPQSTLYGADAIGGVVNVLTTKGSGPPHGALSIEGGSYETFRGQGAVSGAFGPFNFSLSASRTTSEGQGPNDDAQQWAAATRLGYDFPWRGSLTVTGRYADSSTGVPNQGFFPFAFDPDSDQRTQFGLYTARYDQQIFPWWDVTALGGQMWNNQRFENGPLPPGDFSFTSQVNTTRLQGELRNTFTMGRINTLLVGGEVYRDQGENVTDPGQDFAASYTTWSALVQDQLTLFESLYVTGGIRYDYNTTFGGELTPRVAVAYIVKPTDTTVRAAWAEGFRAPTLNDLFFPAIPPCPTFGNPDVKPETSTSWEAGVDQRVWKRRVRFGATFFYTKFKDLITFDTAPPPAPSFCVQATNVGRTRAIGVETYAEADPFDWLQLAANYTFTDTEDLTTGQPLARQPRNRFNAAVTVLPTSRLSLFLQAFVVSDQFDPAAKPGGGTNPGYYRIDAGGTATLLRRVGILDRLDFTLRMQNLTDTQYSEVAGFPALGFSVIAGLTGYFR